ncbi:MAG: hypothetical protein FWC43_01995 [Planctomycetaceae bacterium]|nr:hypothetical protein [Planctomycetaceae bacterium]
MSFLDFFWSSSKKQRQNPNTKSLRFETLENREMLSITSILPSLYTDTISTAGSQAAMYLELTSDSSSKWVTVGLVIEAAGNSTLDPSKITVKYQNTDNDTDEISYVVLPDWAVLHETDGTSKSTIIFNVPAGTYQVLVGGDHQTTGAFTADVYVPGGTQGSSTAIPQYTPVLVQAGLQQMSGQWNMSMESIYKKLLGTNYSNDISAAHPELNVTGTGRLNEADALILGLVAGSGNVTAKLTKTEPEPGDDLTFSAASLSTTEKATVFGNPTAAITVTGGSSTSLSDYNVTLNSTYAIASSYGGVNLSGGTLPTLVSGTDYKFEGGKFYFNPNGKFNFIPKGTTATLTLTFTATDKTDTTKSGTGTITVTIVGANDTPVLDKTDVDITPNSTTCPVEIWSEPWSTTTDGVTTYRSDEVALVIDGKNIKIGNTVIATISDPDVGDTFEFATIGYPAGSVTFENSTWTLWNGTDSNKKAVGEIRLSTDKRTLYYKAVGARSDSAFHSLEDGELSDKMKFTFTVTDNHKITSPTGEDRPSESGNCAVEFQVKRKVDPQMGLSLTRTGTTSVSVDIGWAGQNPEPIPLSAFFTIDYTGEKTLWAQFESVTVTDAHGLPIPAAVESDLKDYAINVYVSHKTDGSIIFDRSAIFNSETENYLNALTDEDFINFSFRVKVMNTGSDSEYVISEPLSILFRKASDLVLPAATLSVSQHDTNWVSSAPVEITGGAKQVSPAFYAINFTGNPVISYPLEGGQVHNVDLEEGTDYKCEIVVMNPATGKLGVVFSFNPNGKFDFLNADQNATVELFVLLEDTINPNLSSTSTLVVTIRGEEAPVAPTFKNNVNLSTDENQPLTIEGRTVAESTKTGAALVIDEIRVKVEDVERINDTVPNASVAVDGFYVITRPAEDEQTVQLKSGTIILLDAEGKIKFDPTSRTTKLPEYNESDPTTYADEKITLLVKDVSGTTPVPTASAKEFTVRVKGINQNPAPTFKNIADGTLGAFQNETCTITANDLATSTKPNAVLSIKSITLLVEEVEDINGTAPVPDEADERYCTLTRPQTGEIAITFESGSVITFHSDGTLTFNPNETTTSSVPHRPLEPYVVGQVDTYRDETLGILVEDTSGVTPIPTETVKNFKIRAKGVIYPLFKESVASFVTVEDTTKTIRANDIATSAKTDAELVIEEVRVNAENVERVNGADPGVATDGMYKISRPASGTQTILLASGSLITLDAAGEVTFDPTGRSDELEGGTYANEKLTLLVKDISGAGATSRTTKEFTIRINAKPATDGLQVFGGPFQVHTFATVGEIPEGYAVMPDYRVDGVAAGTDYTFSLVEIFASFEEDGDYYESLSSPFSVGTDGKILIDKGRLVQCHSLMGASGFTTEYYQITVKAVKSDSETELTVNVPLTLQYVAPPGVIAVTTLDGTEIAAGAKWEISKTADHQASIAIAVSDLNEFARSGQWYAISEIAVIDWKFSDWDQSWTKSEVEAGKDAGDEEMTALYTHVASLLDPSGVAFVFALEEQPEPGTYLLDFNMSTGSDFNFIGAFQSLELQYELVVMDNDYYGQTPIRFTIVVQD